LLISTVYIKLHAYKIWLENMKGTEHSEDLGIDGMIILKWILGKEGGKVWTEFI